MPSTVIESTTRNPILVQLGKTEPAFTDVITRNGDMIDPAEIKEVKFYMRPLLSRIPNINGETAETIEPIDEEGNNVRYKWLEADVSEEGEYMAWWGFVVKVTEKEEEEEIEAKEQQTPEFPILISDHGPGIGIKTGAIYDGIYRFMPITVDALSKSSTFGERRIQTIVELIQFRVLKSAVPADEEILAYELPLLDYFSKRVALELCTPGIDYWARQHRTATTQGPTEVTSFPDMIAALERLRDRLVIELEENWRELAFFFPEIKQRKAVPMPGSSLEFHDTPEANGTLVRRQYQPGFVTLDPKNVQRPLSGNWWDEGFTLLGKFQLGFWPFP